jgi:hypothetical protein
MERDIVSLVEPDRVRREVYTDPAIFDLEMRRIHETVWIYCGHETQVPKIQDQAAARRHDQRASRLRLRPAGLGVTAARCSRH